MNKFIIFFVLVFLFINNLNSEEVMIMKLKNGDVQIELYPQIAPNHVKRFKDLSAKGLYDGVVFHRVIEGFMAQSGDVKFGNSNSKEFNLDLAGTGGSNLPDLEAEFSDTPHERGLYLPLDQQIQIVQIVNFLFVSNQLHIWIDNILFLEKLLKAWS